MEMDLQASLKRSLDKPSPVTEAQKQEIEAKPQTETEQGKKLTLLAATCGTLGGSDTAWYSCVPEGERSPMPGGGSGDGEGTQPGGGQFEAYGGA